LDSQSGIDGNWTTATFSAPLDAGPNPDYTAHGRLRTSGISGSWLGASACYDEETDRLFIFPQTLETGSLAAYFDVSDVIAAGSNPYPAAVSGVTTFATPNRGGGFYNASVVCPSLRRLALLSEDNDNTATFHTYQLDNLGAGPSSHTVTGTQPWGPYYNGGIVWHNQARRFYSYNSGGNTVRIITVPVNVNDNWTGTSTTLGGDTAPGTGSDNGSAGFSRFNIIPDMGNGEACLVWYPSHTVTGIYVCRVPNAGLS
jgi:hypothetical protein